MKKCFLLPVVILSATIATVLAADPALEAPTTPPAAPSAPEAPATPAAAAPSAPDDLSAYKTADDLYKYFQTVENPPAVAPKTAEEQEAMAKKYFTAVSETAAAFVKAYPTDPRRWKVLLEGFNADQQKRRFAGSKQPANSAEDRARLDAIINADDAPENIKNEAAFSRVITYLDDLHGGQAAYADFYREAAVFMVKYSGPSDVMKMKGLELQVISEDPTTLGEAALKALASDSNERVAQAATAIITKRAAMAELKAKPVELAFTGVNGEDIDVAKMRGKVVLVDFWASWCGPCMHEMPNVVATYDKLHDKGFEIVGISLDQSKDPMTAAMKKQNMTWPQYFDGLGWKNKISTRYGINAIPESWLIDKKGMLRESNLRGPALAEAADRLLKEE